MTKVWPSKDPDERLDYTVDWTDRLSSETITNSTWAISGLDAVLTTDGDAIENPRTKIWLLAGTLNKTYYVLNHITTSGGRIMEQTVKIKIRAK